MEQATLNVLIALAGLAGAAWGYVSDRIGARWPAHEDGSIRRRDWRTILVVLVGGLAGSATLARFWPEPAHLVVIGVYVVAQAGERISKLVMALLERKRNE